MVCPGFQLMFDAVGTVLTSAGNTVRKPPTLGPTAVTLSTTALASSGTRPVATPVTSTVRV